MAQTALENIVVETVTLTEDCYSYYPSGGSASGGRALKVIAARITRGNNFWEAL